MSHIEEIYSRECGEGRPRPRTVSSFIATKLRDNFDRSDNAFVQFVQTSRRYPVFLMLYAADGVDLVPTQGLGPNAEAQYVPREA
jgi:hypothetical protein